MLLVGLTAFLSLQHLTHIPEPYSGSVPATLLIGLTAMLAVIAVPGFGRVRVAVPVGLTCAAYIVVRLAQSVLHEQQPLWGGLATYFAVAELSLLVGLVLLAHKMAATLTDAEQAVEELALAEYGEQTRKFDPDAPEIRTPMILSRRHGRPLSVLVVEPEPDPAGRIQNKTLEDLQKVIARRHAHASVARTLTGLLRRSDVLMTRNDRGGFVIVCPDTDEAGSVDLSDRVKAAALRELGLSVRCGRASFPNEALTVDELVEAAMPATRHAGEVVSIKASRGPSPRIGKGTQQSNQALADRGQ
jgi:hypothetical protein